ncbi:MAG TPA: ABC transporter permease [Terriglobales bacterium]|nr:ABC transporter permease [Terriglobales bacterium]
MKSLFSRRRQAETHEQSGRAWLEDLLQDLHFGARMIRKSPGLSTVAILTLALGIGANAGVFSVVNTLLWRSLPFREPDRLTLLQNFVPPHDSAKQFHDWRGQRQYFQDAAVFEDIDANLRAGRGVIRAHVAGTSWNFFSVLGTQLALGDGFASGDDVDGSGHGLPGSNAVAVIGYGLWQELFGGSPRALGASIRVQGNPLTVIGVAPPGFDYPNKTVVWSPGRFSPGNDAWVVIGRLKSGISLARAQAQFAAEGSPERPGGNNLDARPRMISLRDALLGSVKDTSLMLMGAVSLVLLIACTNLAGLLMARTAGRAAELSVRSALGASRARLARQLLTECLLLSSVAAAAGVLVAFWVTSLAAKVEPPPLGAQSYSVLNGPVVIFIIAASAVTAALFGVLPLRDATRLHSSAARGSVRTRDSRIIHDGLTVAQVTFTIVLLAGAVSIESAFVRLMRIDRGYEVKGIATVSVSLGDTTHQGPGKDLAYFEQVLDRIRQLPSVRSASATEFLPLYASTFIGGGFGMDGRPANHAFANPVTRDDAMMVPIFSEYFQTMGGRILFGREFNDAEVRSGAKVAVVDERFAREFGPPADAIGRQLTNPGAPPFVPVPAKIIGVVRQTDYDTDPAVANERQVFVPYKSVFASATIVTRVSGRVEDHLAAIRDTIRSVDPQVPVYSVKTMQQRLDETFARPSFYRIAIWIFGGFALLLTVIGIYGLLAYRVAQRTNEIGIRMALGATQTNLMRMVLRHALLLVFIGLAAGVPLAFFTRSVAASLIGSAPASLPEPIAIVTMTIVTAALVAAYLPARRAMRVDPMVALRHE